MMPEHTSSRLKSLRWLNIVSLFLLVAYQSLMKEDTGAV